MNIRQLPVAIANHPRINPLIWVDGRATSAAAD
jgi:hypothetical protein